MRRLYPSAAPSASAVAQAPEKAKTARRAKTGSRPARNNVPRRRPRNHPPENRRPSRKRPRRRSRRRPNPKCPEQWVTLGSASDTGPYRMLVTLASRGAALARVELSRYYDIDDRSGYLGHLTTDLRPRRRLSGAGRRFRHPRRRRETQGGRRYQGRGREGRLGPPVAGSPAEKKYQSRADRATVRRPRGQGGRRSPQSSAGVPWKSSNRKKTTRSPCWRPCSNLTANAWRATKKPCQKRRPTKRPERNRTPRRRSACTTPSSAASWTA